MNKIKAVVIEDELPASRLLCSNLSRLRPDWEIESLPGTIEDSVAWFASHPHPDILFLDIQLTDGNSFMFIEQAHPKSFIVFTTAYDTYAVKAFEVNSIDYLLKPIHQERLLESILRFEKLNQQYAMKNETSDLLDVLLSLSSPEKKYRTRFLISGTNRLFTLQVTDIAYFLSENKTTLAVTKNNQMHIIDISLDKLNNQLNPDHFFRANRQFILGIDAIKRVEPYFNSKMLVSVVPAYNRQIIASKEKATQLKMWLNY